jgi:mono/diheme cytochrome c family protein
MRSTCLHGATPSCPLKRCHLNPGRKCGSAAHALLFWGFGFLLFVVPFFRDRVTPSWGRDDPRSRVNWEDADVPFNSLDIPFGERVAQAEADLGESLGGSLSAFIEEHSQTHFGVDSEALRAGGVIEFRRLAAGRQTYNELCAGCHGGDLVPGLVAGDGAGPAARFMKPRPRNFRKGMFKFSSTDSGLRPTRMDLYKVVSNGLQGASMPHFKLLTEERRWDVVEYVRYLSLRGEFEELLLTFTTEDEEFGDPQEVAEIVNTRWHPAQLTAVFPSSPEPEHGPDSIARGRELYMGTKAGCAGCHGETGIGDGPSAEEFEDGWGYAIRPRDFTGGVYRAGSANSDLWGVVATGINGTPMGAFGGVLSSDEIWDIVHFVRSLETKENK